MYLTCRPKPRSILELLPLFAKILKNAVQICDAEYGQMFLFEEGSFRAVATTSRAHGPIFSRVAHPFLRIRSSH